MPIQRPIPIWIGGGPGSVGSMSVRGHVRVLRRIARTADGWFPSFNSLQQARILIPALRKYVVDAGRDPSEVGIDFGVSIADGDPDESMRHIQDWRDLGVTHVTLSTVGSGLSTVDEHIKALERFSLANSGILVSTNGEL